MSQESKYPPRVLLAFASVYVFWGSTYLAIKIAGEHLPAPLVSAARSLISAVVIFAICMLRGQSLRVPGGERWKLALVGVLFMSANNMLLTWGEKMVPSGFASLVVSTMPIQIALLEVALPGGERMNRRGWAGTLLGTAGITVLVWPSLTGGPTAGHPQPVLGVCVLLLAAFSFAVGSILSRRFRFQTDTFVATGWQLAVAAVVNWAIVFGGGNLSRTEWTWRGFSAVLYLSVFGSLFGLVALNYLLQHVPVSKVATYAFVNPVIAVLLGAVLLHERLAPMEFAGMGVIVCAVAMVVLSRAPRSQREIVGTAGTRSSSV